MRLGLSSGNIVERKRNWAKGLMNMSDIRLGVIGFVGGEVLEGVLYWRGEREVEG